ncbi:RagB/SusD family nutrient uptake outer membrane protein [Chondrinema litorale]|uniref:RagB/SusD family nutrient uptake outer membrane protein n=1 Tax=Chondrinema litorale TaxID=2994555 RepID=UPI002543F1A2|nr:RagB/SusD family nutrient uptake outer membrane protein [Chondrinema litorale]UZR99335.1 RagB/SusD family nutrient uptake outer membrane protein [Chondrinema litorale]
MKKILYISPFYIVLTICLLSCNQDSFFALESEPEAEWADIEEFEEAATGTYWAAFVRSSWDNLIGCPALLKTVQSDVVQLLPGTTGDIPFNEMYLRSSDLEISKTLSLFRSSYRVINIANAGLQFIADNGGQPFDNLSSADEENNLRRIEGELHFMRGFAYWMLSTVFLPIYNGGENDVEYLPLKITFDETLDAIKSPEIGTVENIYAQLIDDFTIAKELLPERFEATKHHASYAYGRANKFAASAMLAKVYFMMDNYEAALTELDFVIDENGGDFDLSEDPIEAFNRDDNTRGNEVIWYALFYDPVARANAFEVTSMTLQSYNATNGGDTWPNGFTRITWNQFAFSYSILSQIGWMEDPLNGNFELTEEAKIDKRFQQLYRRLKGYNGNENADPSEYETIHGQITDPVVWCDKYFRGKTTGLLTNVPVLRLAEMHLTRALLRYRTGNTTGAVNDLNIVRERAGLNAVAAADLTEDIIHIERIKELSFEGDRLDYLRSAKLSIPGGDRGVAPTSPDDHAFVWKIPQREIDLTSSL